MRTPFNKTAPQPADRGNNKNQGENLPDRALETIAAGIRDGDTGYAEPNIREVEERLKERAREIDAECARIKQETENANWFSGKIL